MAYGEDESGDAAGFYSQAVYSVIDLFNLRGTRRIQAIITA